MKKRRLLSLALALLMLLGCMSLTAFADGTKQLTVNDGTETNTMVPFFGQDANTPSQEPFYVTQFIQPATTLTAMKNGTITQMGFHFDRRTGAINATYEVRLMEIKVPYYLRPQICNMEQATVVYTGKANIVNNQVVITFTTPYEYKGGNLVVDFRVVETGVATDIWFYGAESNRNSSISTRNNPNQPVVTRFLPKVTFDYIEPTYLDLESTATYADKQTIDTNYTFDQADEEYTDVTKVKLDWTINDMAATYKSHKTWDPDQLKWVETKEDVAASAVTATFNLENYSSIPLDATVAFTAESGITATATYTDNAETTGTSDGIVALGTRDDGAEEDITGKVVVSVPADTDYFKTLTESTTGAKYGTYTISLATHKNYLTFTALEDDSTIALNPYSGYFWYSLDNGKTWLGGDTGFTTDNEETITLKNGEKVLFKGKDVTTYDDDDTISNIFSMSGKIAASGSVTSLTDGVGVNKRVKLTKECYDSMFIYCEALTTAPELPAINLAEGCYEYMFYGCTSLTVAPELPATTLAAYCYYCMFGSCDALITAPELPAMNLAESCYEDMFYHCTALVSAPELPATTLADSCYKGMFYGCTVLMGVPELPADTLADYCYQMMFQECSSLTVAPELSATTLAKRCYYQMFSDCSSLKVTTDSTVAGATAFFACPTSIPDGATYFMFYNTAGTATGTAHVGQTYYWYTE